MRIPSPAVRCFHSVFSCTISACRAHGSGFRQVLLYEPSGALQQPRLQRQLELALLQQRLTGAVRLQRGWQPGSEAATAAADGPAAAGGELTAVLLAAGDGQWPLLAAAATGSGNRPSADAPSLRGAAVQPPAAEARTDIMRNAAIEEAIQAPGRLRRRLQAAAGPLAGSEPDFVLVRRAFVLSGCQALPCECQGLAPLAACPCFGC